MSDHRLLVEPGTLAAGATVPLDAEESNHLRVRRAEAGQSVQLFDGAGVTARATLVKAGKGWQVAIESIEQHSPEPLLILAVGAGDRDRFLSLAEKCTELGVTDLIPLETERSVAVETRLRDSGVEKGRKRTREACKQCGNPWATRVHPLRSSAQLAADFAGVRWMLADPRGGELPPVPRDAGIGWVIGPEGGLTDAEIAEAVTSLHATTVKFAKHVLRFETAAIVAAVALSFNAHQPIATQPT